MARSVRFTKAFPFTPKAKANVEVHYSAGRDYHGMTNEAADAAVAGGYGEEIAAPTTREEMAEAKAGAGADKTAAKPKA